jgi:uncharacterized protein YpmB
MKKRLMPILIICIILSSLLNFIQFKNNYKTVAQKGKDDVIEIHSGDLEILL